MKRSKSMGSISSENDKMNQLTRSTIVLAAEGCGVLGGLMGCKPTGVSARMWKWDVGGGPIRVGLESMST